MLKSVDSCFQLWVVVYVVDRLWFRKIANVRVCQVCMKKRKKPADRALCYLLASCN